MILIHVNMRNLALFFLPRTLNFLYSLSYLFTDKFYQAICSIII